MYDEAGRKDKVTEVLGIMGECLPESLLPYIMKA